MYAHSDEHRSRPTGMHGARLAATVLLVRDSAEGMQIWVQERVSTMRHFPCTTVVPGGGVDHRDFPHGKWNTTDMWRGTPVESLAEKVNLSWEQAHAVVFAAVRELFEETGILLAVDDDGQLITDVGSCLIERRQLTDHQISLTEVLHNRQLRVSADLLVPWDRWVGGPKRESWHDVVTFLAILPSGQAPDGETSEADDAGWFTPQLILDGWRAGLVRMAPSTWAQIRDLSYCSTVTEAVAAANRHDLTPIIDDPVDEEDYAEYFHRRPKERIYKDTLGLDLPTEEDS